MKQLEGVVVNKNKIINLDIVPDPEELAYWTPRITQLEKGLGKSEKELEKKLKDWYDTSAGNVNNMIAQYYAEIGKDNVIEFRQLLQKLPDKDVQRIYKDFTSFLEEYPQYSHLIPVRETIYKLNRLEGLEYSTRLEMAKLYAQEIPEIENHLASLANDAYLAAMQPGMSAINPDVAKLVVGTEWASDMKFSDRIWKQKEELYASLHNEISNGFIRGDSYAKMAKKLQKKFDAKSYEAMRLVYTEGTFIMNETAAKYFEKKYDAYKISSINDSDTCEICKALRNEVFNFSERKPGFNFPPLHPNCRCKMIPVIVRDKDIVNRI